MEKSERVYNFRILWWDERSEGYIVLEFGGGVEGNKRVVSKGQRVLEFGGGI